MTSAECVHDWVLADFGIDLTSLESVGHGADGLAELWRARSLDGHSYAVKLTGGGASAGLVVSSHLTRLGVSGVVGPLTALDGHLCSQHLGRRLSVVPWVSVDRAINAGMSPLQWKSYGALLASVHATEVTEDLARVLPREQHTHERLTSAVRVVDRRLRLTTDPPTGRPVAADQLTRALAHEWSASADRLSSLLDGADRLGRELRNRHTPGVVCHGDPHLGNLLVGGDERVWLVDWDDAVLAPRERDLMFVIGGVLAFAPVNPQEQSWFFDGYGAADIDPARLAYYRCTRALEDLVDPATQVADIQVGSEAERADAMSIVTGVLSPTGLVSLAMSSLRDLGLIVDERPATDPSGSH